MSIATFIPAVWEARLLNFLGNNHVYGNLVNRDYEGNIKAYGDTVHINSLGAVTIKKYNRDSDIDAPEELNTTDQTLVIDQANYFNFGIKDIDKAQARTDLMDSAMSMTAYGLADSTDKFIADLMAKGAGIKVGNSTTPIEVTPDNVYSVLVDLKVKMDKANVPKEGRWVVVPPEFEGALLLDPRFTATGGTKAEENMTNGFIARGAGFNIYTSNNVPVTGGKYSIISSTNMSTSFAEQIVETEAFRPEKSFMDAMKGLNVYGAKVTMPEIVALLTATFTTGTGA